MDSLMYSVRILPLKALSPTIPVHVHHIAASRESR